MKKITEQFKVRFPDGTVKDAVILQDEKKQTMMDGTKRSTVGLKEARLVDGGGALNFIDNKKFKVVATGEEVTRI